MRKKIVMGNWKMNGTLETIRDLLDDIVSFLPAHSSTECVVFPPAIYLPYVSQCLSGMPLTWGAQNVYPKDAGAFTGELSALMLKDFACRYVLVGHSERRHLFCEDEKFVAKKFQHVKEHGMIPVLCIGETLSEREQGQTFAVLEKQLLAVMGSDSEKFNHCVLAYEPVWAIGTGKTATPDQVQDVHGFIRSWIAKANKTSAASLSILYGGSVNAENAQALFAKPDVDGGLVGGASLDAQQFVEIVKCIN